MVTRALTKLEEVLDDQSMSLHFKKRRFDAVQKQYEKYEETVTTYVGFFDSIEEREPKEVLLAMDERQGRLFMAQERIESGLQIEGDIAAKLPQISLQKFNGNFSEWTPFWSNFETLVHNMDEQDLQSCLRKNRHYYCENRNILRKDFKRSCLAGLYLNRPEQISQLCPIKTEEAKEVLTQVGLKTFPIVCARTDHSTDYLPR